ncbi:hypothetical protein LJK88_45170 [Paenibacillus sp. P26]|nr:hypothetical protein LJK88_45170 [Paenibacillus sp. P26]
MLRYVPAVRAAAPSAPGADYPARLWRSLSARGWLTLASGFAVGLVFFGMLLSGLSPLAEDHLPPGGELRLFGAAFGAASLAGAVQAARWAWSPFLSPWIGRQSDGRRGRSPLYLAALGIAALTLSLLARRRPSRRGSPSWPA